jgi:hypothetical protein
MEWLGRGSREDAEELGREECVAVTQVYGQYVVVTQVHETCG